MKICMICEGSYPYVSGGVSGWVQMLIKAFPQYRFIIWSIATNPTEMSVYKYELPDNVSSIETVYLGEGEWEVPVSKIKLNQEEERSLQDLIYGDKVVWKDILTLVRRHRKNLSQLLKSKYFYDCVLALYQKKNLKICFNEYLWTFRGMYFPLLKMLGGNIPKADIYHSVSTGYAGVLGSVASFLYDKKFMISEHGIYTREREEDIIRTKWLKGEHKEFWIDFFKKQSDIAYGKADIVTTLFQTNKMLQLEMGCPEEKIRLIPNGVDKETYDKIEKITIDDGYYHIGAIVRIVPIKDIKTMLLAFDLASRSIPKMKLHILGNYDENEEYYFECKELVNELNIQNVEFYGQVDIKQYLSFCHLLLLSSISEGQPLAVLEGMAAGIPHICTNVGSCLEMMDGKEGDQMGKAGFIVPVMEPGEMGKKIVYCAAHEEEMLQMGKIAKQRVAKYYRKEQFLEQFAKLYEELDGAWQE